MANDNPKKDKEVDFVQDILPAFGKKIEESAATQLGIKQRTTRSLQRNADMGRVVMFTYTNPKGYLEDSLRYHHKFPVSIIIDADSEYITGINPFYIPAKVRSIVIKQILQTVDNKTNPTVESRSMIRYDTLSRTAVGAYIKPAIKKYLKSRAGSVGIQFSPELWEDIFLGKTASRLETLWARTSKSVVFRDYVRKLIR